MAESKLIKGSDLIAPNFLENSIEQAETFLKVIKETKDVILATNKATTKKLKEAAKGSTSKDLKDANNLMSESIKQRKLAAAAIVAEDRALLDIAKSKKALADFNKKEQADREKAIKIIERQNSAYAQASDKLNKLRKEYKDLAISGKSADKASQDMLKTIQALDKELKEVDAATGQFNRSVGDYKNQVGAAIQETELFTKGLDKLGSQQNEIIAGFTAMVGQLKNLKKGEDAAEGSANKLSKTLKGSVIGVVLTLVSALSSFFTSSREGGLELDLIMNKLKASLDVIIGSLAKIGKGLVMFGTAAKQAFKGDFAEASETASKAMDEISSSFDGNVDRLSNQIDAYDELTRAIFASEDALKKMNIQLDQAKMDEEDFNEIQNDNTISLNRQKAALEGAIKARLEQAKISKEISDVEYLNAVRQAKIELRKNHVSEENIELLEKEGYQAFLNSNQTIKLSGTAIDALQDKFIAQQAAADALDDLSRQEAERERQMLQTKTINEIELIRSKKLGADAQVKILTKQIADEKEQLEDRERFNDELRTKQLEAQEAEIKLLGNFGLKASEVQDLINEKDAVKLANNITALRDTRLSQEATDELAKVVLEAQNNDIAYQEQKQKFDEERIKRSEKILQLEREIFIINEQSVLSDVERMEQDKQKILDESNANVLESNNVFNKKLLAQRKTLSNETSAIIEEENKIKADLLLKQHEIDQENIKNSIADEQIRAKESEKLTAQYKANLNKLKAESENKTDAFKEKEIAQMRAIELRKTEIVVDALAQATAALSEELDKRQALQDEKAARQIDKTQQGIEKQRDLAARGLANTLAYQEELLAKQQLQQQDAAKRAAKQKEALAMAESLFNAYNAELKQPNANPTTAAAKALADVLLFKGLAAGIVQFAAEGNDRVQGPGTRTSDSVPFMLSVDEGVVKASANMSNPGVVSALNNDMFDKLYMPKYDLSKDTSMANNMASSLLIQSNKEVVSLLTEIKNKPIQHVDVDGLGNLIETIHKNGMKTVTKHKNRRSIG